MNYESNPILFMKARPFADTRFVRVRVDSWFHLPTPFLTQGEAGSLPASQVSTTNNDPMDHLRTGGDATLRPCSYTQHRLPYNP